MGLPQGKQKILDFRLALWPCKCLFLNLSTLIQSFHQGTLNLDISPYSYDLGRPSFSFSDIKWSKDLPPENFSFFACSLINPLDKNKKVYPSFVYWPHPSTKPGFEQPSGVLEILAPYIPELHYGMSLVIKSRPNIITFEEKASMTG